MNEGESDPEEDRLSFDNDDVDRKKNERDEPNRNFPIRSMQAAKEQKSRHPKRRIDYQDSDEGQNLERPPLMVTRGKRNDSYQRRATADH